MTAFVMILFGLITRYAGGWGVPYFSFTSDRGSPCTNKLTGYVCDPLTLADVQFYSDVELPADTKVISGTYVATHDYVLTARARGAEGVGGRRDGRAGRRVRARAWPATRCPMATTQLTAVCVLANDDAVTREGEPPSRLYVIGTGVRTDDGTRVVDLTVRSR